MFFLIRPKTLPCMALLLTLVLTAAMASDVRAQTEGEDSSGEQNKRPKIGIALGGGGARGAAHVGVLRVLKDMNIPIDYVSGTSMGSIVGALYSIGLSPDEIEKEITAVDWDDLFSDRPQRMDRNYRRKQDDSAFFLPVEFGIKNKGVVFSSGIIAGQKLGFAFRNPNLYIGGHNSFDDLAYPFRPIATDLSTGEMVVLERGNLLKAVRASMSIPGVFPTVEWDGKHLVDGYLARNLPVDVVRDMGADIVIAVDVGSLPADTDPEIFNTLTGVGEQQGIIQARQNVDIQIPDADIVIQVDLHGISTRDFKLVAETIPLGEEAALAQAEQLQALSISHEDYLDHLQMHRMIEPDILVVDSIELVNNSAVDDRAIMRHLHQEIGTPLDLDQLKGDLGEIFDFGVFELVDFELVKDEAGNTTLRIITNTKYYAPNILNFGLTYSGGSEGRSYLDARLRVTKLEMNRFGSELRTDVQLGRSSGIQSEYYQPLYWTRRPFVTIGARWINKYEDWFIDDYHLGDFQTEEIMGMANLGYRLGHYGEFRMGLEYGSVHARDKTNLNLYEFKGPMGGFVGNLNFDMLDASVLPKNGYRISSRLYFGTEGLGSEKDYTKGEARLLGVKSWGKDSFYLTAKGGGSFGTDLPEFEYFTLGGNEGLEGFRTGRLRGQIYGLGTFGWYRKIKGHPSPYSTSWYVSTKVEVGNAWRDRELARVDDMHFSGSVALIIKTIMGPFRMAYSRTDDGNDSVSLTLGRLLNFLD